MITALAGLLRDETGDALLGNCEDAHERPVRENKNPTGGVRVFGCLKCVRTRSEQMVIKNQFVPVKRKLRTCVLRMDYAFETHQTISISLSVKPVVHLKVRSARDGSDG